MLHTPAFRYTAIAVLAALILAWILATLGSVLAPFAAATILAYAAHPVVAWLERRSIPTAIGALFVIVALALILVALAFVIVPIVRSEIEQVRERLPALASALAERLGPWIRDLGGQPREIDAASVRSWLLAHMSESADSLASGLWSRARAGGGVVVQLVVMAVLVPVLLFYLLVDWPGWLDRARSLLPGRWIERWAPLLQQIDTLLGQYLRGQLRVMLVLAVYYSAALGLVGLRLWLPIGLLTGLMIAIPYLGFATGLFLAVTSALLQFGPSQGVLAVLIVYAAGQGLEGFWLTPRLVGERIGLHPLAVILALLVFGDLFGFVGVLLALPVSAVLSVLLRSALSHWRSSETFHQP